MSSFEKHEKNNIKKKKILYGSNFLLSPLNKKVNSLNYFSVNRKNSDYQSRNDIKIVLNKLNPEQYRKKNNINSEQINNILKLNKAYSLSRPKNINKLNSNKILSTYSNVNSSNLSPMKGNIKYNNNLTTDDLNNNIDINNNNNAYNLKKLYINKKIKEINFFAKNDSFNNRNNFSTNRQSFEHLKTDVNITPKESNIKLILPDKNYFDKKLENQNYDDIIGTPSGLFKKNNFPNFHFNTPGNVLKNYYNNPNIKVIKDEKIIIDSYTNQSTNDSKNKIKKKSIDRSISGKGCFNNKVKINKKRCPEDLHFYYINMIQKGKKLEKDIEGE